MGTDAPAGLQAGINAGRSGRIPAMESAAHAAVEAVEFHDPYRVAPAGTSPMGGNGTLK